MRLAARWLGHQTQDGVLSHWPRGRQPSMTAQAFQSRWCHEEVVCSRPDDDTGPARIHWAAAHPVPLPQTQPAGALNRSASLGYKQALV